MCWGASAEQHSVPLALASLGLGSRRPLDGLAKFSSGKFRMRDEKHEAHVMRSHLHLLQDQRTL
jgi:hypothetical protein